MITSTNLVPPHPRTPVHPKYRTPVPPKYRTLVPTIIILLLTSCSDFLKESPKGALYEDEAYNSLTKLENNALLNIYNYIGGSADSQGLQGTGKGVYDLNSVTTDEQIVPTRGGDWYDGGLWQRLFMHTWSAGEGPFKDTWDYLYKVVMMCNEGIERFENYRENYANGSERLRIDEDLAELRTLRAMYYFYIMDLYGRVPLVTSTDVKASELTLSPRRDTYLFIVKELQEVVYDLYPYSGARKGTEYYGRMTQGVAYFLLAKLMINGEVYYDNDWTDNQRTSGSEIILDVEGSQLNIWKAAEYYCDLASRFYELEAFYESNFIVNNEQSSENIFTIPMDPLVFNNVYNYFFRSRHYSHGAVLGGASENGPCATVSTFRAFADTGDFPRDARLDVNFYYGPVEENGDWVYMDDGKTLLEYYPYDVTSIDLTGTPHEKTAGARLKKYGYDNTAREDGRMGNNDIVLFRLADVMLVRAEAILRGGGSAEDAAVYLTPIRTRAKLTAIAQPTLDDVLNERLLELMWEGWRRNDLIRFDRFHMPYDIRPQASGEADRHTTVFPIPADVMAMHPDWQQNPGY